MAKKDELDLQDVLKAAKSLINEDTLDKLKDYLEEEATKPEEEMTEIEKLKAEMKILEAKNRQLEIENAFIKKLKELKGGGH